MKKVLLFCMLVLFALPGCDNSGSDGNDGGIGSVSYSVDCDNGPICYNAFNVSSYTSGDTQTIECTWNCSTYQDQGIKYVQLTFVKREGNCWYLEREFTKEALCN